MTGLDTNVLVRYLVRDDPAQTRAATRLIESRCTSENPSVVCSVVLCELIWVLDRGYRYNRKLIAALLRRLLSAEELLIEHSEAAWQALSMYEEGRADFVDYLIGVLHHAAGAEFTYTFDRAAALSPLFRMVPAG